MRNSAIAHGNRGLCLRQVIWTGHFLIQVVQTSSVSSNWYGIWQLVSVPTIPKLTGPFPTENCFRHFHEQTLQSIKVWNLITGEWIFPSSATVFTSPHIQGGLWFQLVVAQFTASTIGGRDHNQSCAPKSVEKSTHVLCACPKNTTTTKQSENNHEWEPISVSLGEDLHITIDEDKRSEAFEVECATRAPRRKRFIDFYSLFLGAGRRIEGNRCRKEVFNFAGNVVTGMWNV